MDPFAPVLARIDAYLAETGMTATNFGLKVTGTGALVPRLRDGNMRMATIRKIIAFLDKEEKRTARKQKAQ